MKLWPLVPCLALVALWHASAGVLRAATPADTTPSISIVSPHAGFTVYGSSVTVRVSVSNFKLVPPVYVNPPKLSGNQGHIHYVLDSLANFVATRDARATLSHTWTHVSPGGHTILVYLATSQHARFPNTRPAQIHITVAAGPAPRPAESGVSSVPKTGGGGNAPGSSLNWPAVFGALATILLGFALRKISST
jgi:hypothetical protein